MKTVPFVIFAAIVGAFAGYAFFSQMFPAYVTIIGFVLVIAATIIAYSVIKVKNNQKS